MLGRSAVIILLLGVLAYFLLAFSGVVDLPRAREHARIEFPGASFTVEIPNTPYRVKRGFQGRKTLSPGAGMLFVLPKVQVVHFWMKDTLIPLDMIWLDENRHVLHIESAVPPCTASPCPQYGPALPAKYVLEVNAGQAGMAGIRIGDQAILADIPPVQTSGY